MSDLYRLIYTSRSHLSGSEDEQSASVSGILAVSKRNNARVGVTGALLFNAGSFAQILEGPRVAVEATFERIQRDPRHGDVSVLQCEPVTARGFSNWSMAFVGQSPRGRALWEDVACRTDFDMRRMDGDKLFAMLLAIVEEDETQEAAPKPEPSRKGLDVDALRKTLLAEHSEKRVGADFNQSPRISPPPRHEVITPAMPPTPAKNTTEGAVEVLRRSLIKERERTSALRGELDELRIALDARGAEIKELERQRTIWAERAKALAAAMVREPDEQLQASTPMQDHCIALVR